MVRKRLYAKQTASVEYEQIDLFSLLEEEQRQADRIAEQVRGRIPGEPAPWTRPTGRADRRREQARRRCRHARRNHAATCGKTFHTILRHGKQH